MRLDAATQLASLTNQEKQGQTASFQGGDSWADKLTLGQIIKGKVLRGYGDGRYAVDFGGQQKIVDSGVPLSAGDQLRGRVVGLSERVTIERLPNRIDSASAQENAPPRANTSPPQIADTVQYTAQQLNIDLKESDAATIAGSAKKAANPELAVRVGLFLAKLGLPLSAELVRALYERISVTSFQPGASEHKLAPILDIGSAPNGEMNDSSIGASIAALAQYLANDCKADERQGSSSENAENQAQDSQSPIVPGLVSGSSSEGGNRDSLSHSERRFAELLAGVLNVQTGARFQHRFRTLPVIIAGRLVEFDLALFDHLPQEKDGVQAKRLRFSLATEHGPINVDATAIDSHVQIAFSSDQARFLEALEEHEGMLGEGLKRHGWMLAGTTCRQADIGSPARSIVDHVLAQDSLRIAL